MTAAELEQVAARLAVTIAADGLDGGLSGSQVRRATRADGTPAVVKITFSRSGWDRTAAERELAFYRTLRAQVGVRTPELLGHHRSDECVAILLSAHASIRPAERWTRELWLALARDLAVLHETPKPPGGQWRHGADGIVPGSDPERWRSFWRRPGEADLFRPFFDDPESLISAARTVPRCFNHGDCHTDNLLVDDDGLIWVDWQSTGIGRPGGELAFAAGRATPSGATVPLADMIELYAELRGLDPVELDRTVVASGLATVLFVWPVHLREDDSVAADRMHHHARHLAERWLAGR
ncbi:aminoglycoside phosphotransferase family protein [Microlunatus speluncae]|uniref:aminoglycoside phosphotransferase family protein n=1 Tax=Microlunatus speluncae TaxID=2594267 RepID=UPI0012666503|nr:aminoglycoside phosphotransferase family protein [Microlunatus speluncae]